MTSEPRPRTWAVEASRLDGTLSLVIDPAGRRPAILLSPRGAWDLLDALTSVWPTPKPNGHQRTVQGLGTATVTVRQADQERAHYGQAVDISGPGSGSLIIPPRDVVSLALVLGALGTFSGCRSAMQKLRALGDRVAGYQLAVDNSVARALAELREAQQ